MDKYKKLEIKRLKILREIGKCDVERDKICKELDELYPKVEKYELVFEKIENKRDGLIEKFQNL